jgi:hypothetical protein
LGDDFSDQGQGYRAVGEDFVVERFDGETTRRTEVRRGGTTTGCEADLLPGDGRI